MFTRKADRTQRPFEAIPTAAIQPANGIDTHASRVNPVVPPPVYASAGAAAVSGTGANDPDRISVIGRDLTILGAGLKIISKGVLHIDGEVMGDVIGSEIVINEGARVSGLVNAEKVQVHGSVAGTVKAATVVLSARAEVDGDIHHHMLTVEQGAVFIGRSNRPQNIADLTPNLDAHAHADASANGAAGGPQLAS